MKGDSEGKVHQILFNTHNGNGHLKLTLIKSANATYSREAESENASLVVQGMLMEFECRFLKRMVWCMSFDIWLCLNVVHSYGIHGNT